MGKAAETESKRKLSKAEEKRKEKYEALKESIVAQGYEEKDLTISVVYANVMALVLTAPIIIAFLALFVVRNIEVMMNLGTRSLLSMVLSIVCVLALVVVHELIHGLTFSIFAKRHWKSISFGFIAEYMTPYCCCDEPLKRWQYVIGAIMPTVVLGILPLIAAVLTGSLFLLTVGALMTMSGGGDLTIVLKLLMRKENGRECLYVDHPYKVGLTVFEK